MKKYTVFWLVCTMVMNAYGAQNTQKFLLYKQLNQQAAMMTGLIKRYQAIGSLTKAEQQEFVNTLYSFLIEEQSLQYAGEDTQNVDNVEKKYNVVYLGWSKIIITDSDLAQEIKDLHTVIVSADTTNSTLQSYAAHLYSKLMSLIMLYRSEFENAIRQALDNAGTFSISNKKALTNTFQQIYLNFHRSTVAAQTLVKGEYILSLQDPSNLTMQDHMVLQAIDDLVQESQLMVQAMLIDLTSAQIKANVLKDVQDSFALSHQNLIETYQAELYNNEQNLSSGWWKRVKDSGNALITEFSKQFELEMYKQVKLMVAKQIAQLGKQSVVYIAKDLTDHTKKTLSGMSETLKKVSWRKFEKATSAGQQLVAQSIRETVSVTVPAKPIRVSMDYSLMSADEKKFKAVRFKNHVLPALKKLDIKQPLNMAFCCSGGGVRAMIGTVGVLSAAAEHGILQATMYLAGLSGSTWAIAPWTYLHCIGKLGSDYSKSLDIFQQNLIQGLNPENMHRVPSSGMYMPSVLQQPFSQYFAYQLAVRVAYKQSIALVDLFGALVSNFAMDLVGNNKLNVCWSTMAPWLISSGAVPLPLCTAVYDAKKRSNAASSAVTNYAWVEMNPFEVSVEGAGKIPWKYFGSSFVKGKLSGTEGSICPEYPISYVLGVCASLFALHPDDLEDQNLPNPQFNVSGYDVIMPIGTWMRDIISESIGLNNTERRNKYLAATVSNFSQAVPGSAVVRQDNIALLDAGLACNIPLPVLLNKKDRNLDIIFIYDSHAGDVSTIKKASDYILQKQYNVPNLAGVSSKFLTSDALVVFNDPRTQQYKPSQPTFIYIPTMVDSSALPYVTFNFGYTAEQVNTLVDTVSKKFTDYVDDIKTVMKLVAQKRVVRTNS